MTLDEPAVHQRYYFTAQSWRMENINSWLTIPNDLSSTIILKNFYLISTQIIPVSSTKGQVSWSVWGTGHRVIRQPPEITRTCSALSSEMRIKCTRKSFSFDSGKESSLQLCYSPFWKWEGNFIGEEIWPAIVSGIVTGVTPVNYWPIFFSVLSNNPRTLCESKLGWVSV